MCHMQHSIIIICPVNLRKQINDTKSNTIINATYFASKLFVIIALEFARHFYASSSGEFTY